MKNSLFTWSKTIKPINSVHLVNNPVAKMQGSNIPVCSSCNDSLMLRLYLMMYVYYGIFKMRRMDI